MTRVFYMVGIKGNETRCNTLESANEQKTLNPRYTIRTCYEEITEPRKPLSEKRLEWLANH